MIFIMKLLGLRAGGRTSSKEGFVTKTLLDHPRLWGCAPYPPALGHALPRAAANSRIRPKTLRPVPPMATTGHERDGGINLELQSANSYVVPLKKGIHSFKNTSKFPAVPAIAVRSVAPMAWSGHGKDGGINLGLQSANSYVVPLKKGIHSFNNTSSFPAVSDSATPAIPLALSLELNERSKGHERNSDPVVSSTNKQVLIQYIRGHFVIGLAIAAARLQK